MYVLCTKYVPTSQHGGHMPEEIGLYSHRCEYTTTNIPLQISLYELNISEIFEIAWDWPADFYPDFI